LILNDTLIIRFHILFQETLQYLLSLV
jgi:hypothetical protein